jgi:hypothetical protein
MGYQRKEREREREELQAGIPHFLGFNKFDNSKLGVEAWLLFSR